MIITCIAFWAFVVFYITRDNEKPLDRIREEFNSELNFIKNRYYELSNGYYSLLEHLKINQ